MNENETRPKIKISGLHWLIFILIILGILVYLFNYFTQIDSEDNVNIAPEPIISPK